MPAIAAHRYGAEVEGKEALRGNLPMDEKRDNWFDGLEIDDFDFKAMHASNADALDQSSRISDADAGEMPKHSLRLTVQEEGEDQSDWQASGSDDGKLYQGGQVISPFLPGSLAEHLAKTKAPVPAYTPAVSTPSMDGPFDTFLGSKCRKPVVLNVRSIQDRAEGSESLILNAPRFAASTYLRIAAAYIHSKDNAGMPAVETLAMKQDCPLWKTRRRGIAGWRTMRSLAKLCRQLDVAVWHSHDYQSNLMGRLISRVWPMKLVTTVHHWPRSSWRERMAFAIDQVGLKRFDRIITISPQLRDALVDRGHDQNRIEFISTGIDTKQFSRKHDIRQARCELGVSPDATVIGAVARFTKDKGIDRAIKTVADLRHKYPNIELHLIGDGPEFNALKDLARQRHVADRVHFWGWQSPIQRFYELMDLLLVPSRAETTPMVVLEAMAMGVPVAATKVGNVPDLLKGGRRGVLLSNRNRQTWADHLAPLLVSSARRQELSRSGLRRVKKYYSFDRTMHQIMSVYDRVLSINPTKEATAWRRAA